MSQDLSKSPLWLQTLTAIGNGGFAYLVVASVLHVLPWQLDAMQDLRSYLAIAAGLLVCGVIFYRIRHGSWTGAHTDRLLNVELDD